MFYCIIKLTKKLLLIHRDPEDEIIKREYQFTHRALEFNLTYQIGDYRTYQTLSDLKMEAEMLCRLAFNKLPNV